MSVCRTCVPLLWVCSWARVTRPWLEPIVKVQHNTGGKLTEEGLNSYYFNLFYSFMLSKISNCVSLDFQFCLNMIVGLKLYALTRQSNYTCSRLYFGH